MHRRRAHPTLPASDLMHPASSASLLETLRWRYATKQFDPARAIPEPTWTALEESLVLTPSSLGLQPWRFVVVTQPELREPLQAASYGQSQPRDCSHFVVFAVRRGLDAAHIDRHVARTAAVRGVPAESLAKFRGMMEGSVERARREGTLDTWQDHQAYIALGQFMLAAALLGVDTCPMEGIEPAKYDEILGLAGTGYGTVVACAAGYRSAGDKYAAAPKVRFPRAEVVDLRA